MTLLSQSSAQIQTDNISLQKQITHNGIVYLECGLRLGLRSTVRVPEAKIDWSNIYHLTYMLFFNNFWYMQARKNDFGTIVFLLSTLTNAFLLWYKRIIVKVWPSGQLRSKWAILHTTQFDVVRKQAYWEYILIVISMIYHLCKKLLTNFPTIFVLENPKKTMIWYEANNWNKNKQ